MILHKHKVDITIKSRTGTKDGPTVEFYFGDEGGSRGLNFDRRKWSNLEDGRLGDWEIWRRWMSNLFAKL